MLDHTTPAPARIVAHMRMRLKSASLPASVANPVLAALAAANATPDDLTDGQLAELGHKALELTRAGTDAETLAAELAALVESMTESEAEPPTAPTDAKAVLALVEMHGGTVATARDFIARGVPLSGIVAHYSERGPSVTNHKTFVPATARGRAAPSQTDRMIRALAHRIDPLVDPKEGREFLGLGLSGAVMHFARERGLRVRSEAEAMQVVMAGSHTSSDFISTVIGPAVDLSLGVQYEQVAPEILRIARPVERDNYREWSAVRLGAATMPAPVGDGGEFLHGTIDDEGQPGPTPAIRARIVRFSEQAIRNDRLSVLGDAGRYLARGAAEAVRIGLCNVLTTGGNGQVMADGNPLFHNASHGNVASGVLSVANLGLAAVKLRRMQGPGGEALALSPRFLLVAPEQEVLARQLVAEIEATKSDDVNPFSGRLTVLVEPGLAAPAWYLAADPALADGLVMSYVDSMTPRIDQKIAWESPTVEFKLRFDVGFGALDYRALIKSPGT